MLPVRDHFRGSLYHALAARQYACLRPAATLHAQAQDLVNADVLETLHQAWNHFLERVRDTQMSEDAAHG